MLSTRDLSYDRLIAELNTNVGSWMLTLTLDADYEALPGLSEL